MATFARLFLQSLLKAMNSILGLVGIAMILYGLWMVRVWERDMDSSSFDRYTSAPWVICTFIGAGVALCVITCIGHLAANCGTGCCLSCYVLIIFVLLLLETAMAADVLLNSDWEKDLPYDPTGKFNDFKDFVESNFDMFKWIGLLIMLAQGFSILLAAALRSIGPNQESICDSDEEYASARLPLMNHIVQPPEYIVAAKNSSNWNVSIHSYLA
ncbi:hypothetical protein M0R45_013195 [Rubus argutus]|uniref:Tetraspanin-19-like n=1 Tax=Rubus argutus TaxID=59490 RepID=A0AAW1XIC3_RUBAR